MRALIVDDSKSAREVARVSLEAALADLGIEGEVVVAENGMQALKILAQDGIDLMVVDLHMPDLNGLEVLAFWQERRVEGAVAYVSSTLVSDRDAEKARDAGAAGFLEKPVTVEAFAAVLQPRGDGGV